MSSIAMRTGATGLESLTTQIDTIANNLANANTTGYKSSRANFEDLLYQTMAQPGVETADGTQRAVGIQVGLGTKVASIAHDFTQGSAMNTNGELDLMIEGPGFFRVQLPEGQGDGYGYTRAGNFYKNSEGEIVLASTDGYRLSPEINIPAEAVSITVTTDGRVLYRVADSFEDQEAGQINLYGFVNPNGLISIGNNIFQQSPATGDPIEGTPGDDNGLGRTLQGYLESSNVSPVRELIGLIEAQRTFEMNSQVIKAADSTLQVVANIGR